MGFFARLQVVFETKAGRDADTCVLPIFVSTKTEILATINDLNAKAQPPLPASAGWLAQYV